MGAFGMPLDEFTEQAYQGLAAGKEQVPIGMGQEYFESFELRRQEDFHRATDGMKARYIRD